MAKIKLFSATSVNFGFVLNVATLIIQITGIFKTDESWYCIECCRKISPFNSLSSDKKFLACCTNTDSNITQEELSSKLEFLVNQFNNATPENSNVPEKIASFKYYDIDEMHNIEIPHKYKSLSIFHINSCFLNKNFDDLQHLLSCTKILT